MVFGIAYLAGKLLFTAVAVGMGNNRRCGMLIPLLLSVFLSPLVTIPILFFGSGYKHRPDESVFLRNPDGSLIPALDKDGKQKLDPDTQEELYLKRVKDESYYREREHNFLKKLFIELPFAPAVAAVKLVALGVKQIASLGKKAVEKNPETVGRIKKIPEEVYQFYDKMAREETKTEVRSEAESEAQVVNEEESVKEENRVYEGYSFPDGDTCIVCGRTEMENLRVRLLGTDYEGCRLVSAIELQDVLENGKVEGEKHGLVSTYDIYPEKFNLVYDNGRFVDEETFLGVDRKPFDELLGKAGTIADSLSSHSVIFCKGAEISAENAWGIRTGRNFISLMYSGKEEASVRFDSSDGRIVFDLKGVADRLPEFSGVDPLSPSDVVEAFGRVVLSENNLQCFVNSEQVSLEMENNHAVEQSLGERNNNSIKL